MSLYKIQFILFSILFLLIFNKEISLIMKSPSRNCIQLGSKNKSLSREKRSTSFKNYSTLQSQIIQNCSESRTLENSFYHPQRSAIYNFDQQNSRIFYESINFHPQVFHSPQPSRILKVNQNINRSSPFSKQKKTVQFVIGDKPKEFSPVKKLDHIKIASNLSLNCHLKQNKLPNIQTTGITTVRENELARKLKIVEGRLQDLLKERQNIQASFVQQNRKLFHQNQALKQKLKEVEVSESQRIKISQLQEMLQTQINKSLQLMDQTEQQNTKISQLQEQNLKLQEKTQSQEININELKAQNQSLKGQALNLKEQFQKQVESIEEANDQIKMEFTNQVVNLQYLLSQAEQTKTDLQSQLEKSVKNSETLQNTINFQKQQITTLKQKLQAAEQKLKTNSLMNSSSQSFMKKSSQSKEQCKKCQQLLKTVFKLNSHLNKESKQ